MKKKTLGSLVPLMTAAVVISAFSVDVRNVQAAEVVLEDSVESAESGETILTNDKAAETQKQITTMTAEQAGDRVAHARKVLKTSSYGTNLLPTGVAALAGETIKITVEAEEGKPLPIVVFTQQMGSWRGWKQEKKLQIGENVFQVPRIYDETWTKKVIPGGAVYIQNPYTPEQQGRAPKITIEGGHTYPIFFDGDDVAAFNQELQDYKAKLAAEPDKYVDIVELVSDYVIMNANIESAEKSFLKGISTPQKTLDYYNERIGMLFAYAGVSETGTDIRHVRNHTRANIRLMQPWALAYAAGDHTGFQQVGTDILFAAQEMTWGITHEIGHHLDVQGGFIGEVTNNMWANYINVDVQNGTDRMESNYANIFTRQASDDYKNLVQGDGKNDLALWWQLHLLNKDYWANYQTAYRNGVAGDMGLTNYERMAVVSSYALGMDVTEHFERYKFLDEAGAAKVRAAVKELGIPEAPENMKPWYLWTKATKDRTSSFGDKVYTPQILSVEAKDGKLVLNLRIDREAENALLGYEVLRDGKVIGFTRTDSFTTATVGDDGNAHSYKVRAFDLRMNTTGYSEEVSSVIGEAANQQNLAAATENINKIKEAVASSLTVEELAKISNIYIVYPQVEGYEGNDTDMAVLKKIQDKLKGVAGEYVVAVSGGTYKTVDDFINSALYISYQEGAGKPFYTFQNGSIVK